MKGSKQEVVYVCEGDCGGFATEQQYAKGAKRCGSAGCTHFDHPLIKRLRCGKCGQVYQEGQKHQCLKR